MQVKTAINEAGQSNLFLVVLGSGESGTGAALLAKHLGYDVFVSDKGAIKQAYKDQLNESGIAWEENQHNIEKILTADEIIKSPGIPETSEVMQAVRQKGINVIGEIEFGWRHAGKCKIVAITGSNGKTTTTMLTYHLMLEAGLAVKMGGNVGNSFAEMVLEDIQNNRTSDVSRIFVLEVSSFQLDDIQAFKPSVAMLLNITPDHLDRYGYQLENYAAAKFRITMNQDSDDVFIYNGFDPILAANMPQAIHAMAIRIEKDFYQQGKINIEGTAYDLSKSNLRGPHNQFNAACAITAALGMGASADKVQNALNTFQTPPNRLEKVAEIKGVTWINDSKATNVDAVFYALQAMESPTIWIVGGVDKGNDYTPLLPWVQKKVKVIVCMGVDNTKIVKAFAHLSKPMIETGSMAMAVEEAARAAASGDTVLLSPACASFDLFKNYEDRGVQFKSAVSKLVKQLGSF